MRMRFEVSVSPEIDFGYETVVEAKNEKQAIALVRKGARKAIQRLLRHLATKKIGRVQTNFAVSVPQGSYSVVIAEENHVV